MAVRISAKVFILLDDLEKLKNNLIWKNHENQEWTLFENHGEKERRNLNHQLHVCVAPSINIYCNICNVWSWEKRNIDLRWSEKEMVHYGLSTLKKKTKNYNKTSYYFCTLLNENLFYHFFSSKKWKPIKLGGVMVLWSPSLLSGQEAWVQIPPSPKKFEA